MIGAITALWQSHKAVILTAFAAALIIGVLIVVKHIYTKGEKAGAGAVTNAVQTETIKKIEDARISKEKADETIRDKPIDSVIDGLR